jgi:hypothetical protein
MGWIIKYARVGNAEPVYSVRRSDDVDPPQLVSSVYGVMQITERPLKSVRVACKEAREEGVSSFLE